MPKIFIRTNDGELIEKIEIPDDYLNEHRVKVNKLFLISLGILHAFMAEGKTGKFMYVSLDDPQENNHA
jgi:hypothetical protein